MSLRLKISFISACLISLAVLIGFLILLTLVREKRIDDLAGHSKNLMRQIVSLPGMRTFLEERMGPGERKELEPFLKSLLDSNPFVSEITLLDRFGKIPFRVEKFQDKEQEKPPPRATLSLHKVISSGQPSLIEESWEYFVPIALSEKNYWGVLRVRWSPEATWIYFNTLKKGILYTSVFSFLTVFAVSYLVLLRAYSNEHLRLAKKLSIIAGSDYSQRIDTHTFSKSMAEIGSYLNRLISEIHEEKKKVNILDNSLRQSERTNADYRKIFEEKNNELEHCRKELRDSIITLFELLWCGVVVIDETFQIHYINDQAERLLRFAKYEDDVIVDERLRRCLAPLVRFESVDRIEDLCVWPQSSIEQSVSCRVRATAIPTGENTRHYFLLLNEESGFPKRRDSMYFSERLLIDILAHSKADKNETGIDNAAQLVVGSVIENRFRHCLQRIEAFRDLECGQFGEIVPIRLAAWLQKRFEVDDLFSDNLNIVTMMPEADINLFVPELCLSQLVDCTIAIVTRFSGNKEKDNKSLAVRASVDSRGKPVITFTIPHMLRKDVMNLQNVFGEKVQLLCESSDERKLSLDELEQDIWVSLYQCVKKLLKVKAECVYSENKQLITLRLTIEQHIFSTSKEEGDTPAKNVQGVTDLVRVYLNQA